MSYAIRARGMGGGEPLASEVMDRRDPFEPDPFGDNFGVGDGNGVPDDPSPVDGIGPYDPTGIDDLHDIDEWNVAVPSPDDRLWRHPSELAAANGRNNASSAASSAWGVATDGTAPTTRRLCLASFAAPAVVVVSLLAIGVGAAMLPSTQTRFPTATSIPGIVSVRIVDGDATVTQAAVVDPSGLTAIMPAPVGMGSETHWYDNQGHRFVAYRHDDVVIVKLHRATAPAHVPSSTTHGQILSTANGTDFRRVESGGLPAIELVSDGAEPAYGDLVFVANMVCGWVGNEIAPGVYSLGPFGTN